MASGGLISSGVLGPDAGQRAFAPAHFAYDDHASIRKLIADYPLAQICTARDGELRATAAPLFHRPDADGGGLEFFGHIARRNPHVAAIEAGAEALCLFTGPDAYISPHWFEVSRSVSTWSYVAAQLRGRFEPVTDRADTLAILRQSIDRMEAHVHPEGEGRWSLDDADPDRVDYLLEGVMAFRFRGESLEGVTRLNQDKKPQDRESIARGLDRSLQAGARGVARLMGIDT